MEGKKKKKIQIAKLSNRRKENWSEEENRRVGIAHVHAKYEIFLSMVIFAAGPQKWTSNSSEISDWGKEDGHWYLNTLECCPKRLYIYIFEICKLPNFTMVCDVNK
jgi:hypothetical protein